MADEQPDEATAWPRAVIAREVERMSEKWRPISGWPYEVSDCGRVRRVAARQGTSACRLLRPVPGRQGYLRVKLVDRNRAITAYVHRLVLEAFVGPAPAGHEGDHKDRCRTNNALENLRWHTVPQNRSHPGERHGRAKLTWDDVAIIRSSRVTTAQLARRFNLSWSAMVRVRRGQSWHGQL